MKVETTSLGRFYDLGAGWKPSVTTVLKYGFPISPGLVKWLKDQPNAEEADRIRDEAGARGTLAHETIETLLRNGSVELTGLPDDIIKMVIGCSNWFRDHVAEVLEIESTLGDSKVAGRVDAVVRLLDGTLAVVDFKTSKTISESYHCQVAKYVEMWSQGTSGASLPADTEVRGIIVHLKPLTKKGYQAVEVDVLKGIAAFEHAYQLYIYLDMPLAPKPKAELPTSIFLELNKETK